jgi:hypothetical protein
MQQIRLGFAILTSILVIIFLLQPIAQMVAVRANPYMFLQFTKIRIYSPQSQVYVYPNVDVSFDYYVETNFPQVDSFSYSLDSNANSTLPSSKSSIPHIDFNKYSVFKTLENLSNDNHRLAVYAYFSNMTVRQILNTTIVVDTAYIQPTPLMISPLNQTTYNSNEVAVTYSINAKIVFSTYSLDTSEYAPKWTAFTGNTTLANLSEGSHKLMLGLSVQSHSGVMYDYHRLTLYFNVGSNGKISTLTPSFSPTPTATPYLPIDRNAPHLDPTFYLLAISITVALVVLAVFAYKRRKLEQQVKG